MSSTTRSLTLTGPMLSSARSSTRSPASIACSNEMIWTSSSLSCRSSAMIKKYGDDAAGNSVALLTYYAFVATFPLLLVLVTVSEIVLRNHPELQKHLLDSALSEFPVVGPTLQQSLKAPTGTGLALVVG